MSQPSFNEVLEMAEFLSASEQDFLIEILQKRLVEKRRKEIAANIAEARAEYKMGKTQKVTVDELMLMKIAKVSEEGQVIIPSEMGKAYGWEVGQDLILTDTVKGILIQPKKPFVPTTLNEVAGCLKYKGSPKTLDDMEAAIGEGIKEQWHDFS